jgi:hypothetical protein
MAALKKPPSVSKRSLHDRSLKVLRRPRPRRRPRRLRRRLSRHHRRHPVESSPQCRPDSGASIGRQRPAREPAFTGGLATAALGLGLHFLIAFLFAAFFNLVLNQPGRAGESLARRWFLTGPAYGGFVYLMMYLVIVPNSRAPFRFQFTAAAIALNLAIHVFCVGIPIAFFGGRTPQRT